MFCNQETLGFTRFIELNMVGLRGILKDLTHDQPKSSHDQSSPDQLTWMGMGPKKETFKWKWHKKKHLPVTPSWTKKVPERLVGCRALSLHRSTHAPRCCRFHSSTAPLPCRCRTYKDLPLAQSTSSPS